MTAVLEQFDQTIAQLTASGQPFEVAEVEVAGVRYRNFSSMPQNLAQYYAQMRQHGDKEFAVYLEQRFSYGQAYQHAAEFAAALIGNYGVKKGDRVAVLARNSPQWMMAFIGITAIGAVAVPMNAWWTTSELDYGFEDSGAKVVVVDRQRLERTAPVAQKHGLSLITVEDCTDMDVAHRPFDQLLAEHRGAAMPEVEVAADDRAVIMYTSGSTGHPKGALSSHRGVLSALYSWALLGFASKLALAQSGEEALAKEFPATSLLTIPLFHCTGSHSIFLLSILIGRKIVIMHKWDVEEALRLIETERVTAFNGVPTMSAELQAAAASSDRDLSSLVDIFAGGAARPPDQVGKIVGEFKQSSPGIGYGLTETNALGAVNAGPLYIAKPHSTGRAVPAVTEIAIFAESGERVSAGERGEVCIKSPANIIAYWNKPEATAEAFVDGWFHTGDVGYMDEQGFLYIVDRLKEIIIRGGENISCLEVEAAIYEHPAVLEAAAFGLPDERLGEIVGAAVVLKAGQALTEQELIAFVQPRLAAFKIPAHIFLRTEQLPRIATGKIFKRQLKANYSAQLANQRA